MKFYVIGITDQPQPFFAPEVLRIIRSGKVFSGGRRHHDIVAALLPEGARWIDISVPLDAVFEQYARCAPEAEAKSGGIVVFASGDPLFFGFANTLRQRMPGAQLTVFPAFNSLQMLAHRLLLPYHDLRTVSLTGRPWHGLDRVLIEGAPMIGVLTDREHTPAAIARRMTDYGYTQYRMYVGEHLGNPADEHIATLSLGEASQLTFAQPNCVILCAEAMALGGTCGAAAPKERPFGLPDSSFALLDGRQRMITKMPIRLLALQALDLKRRRVLWDIGFCTGSVSIEARLLFPHLQIEAFEVRPECEAIIHENMRRHGAPGIGVHIGDFRSVCCDIIATNQTEGKKPQPDAVFIGGHGGHLKEIMQKAAQCLAPGGVIVMNSVSDSSRRLFCEACDELGLQQAPATHIALNDYNPIDILKCELPS